MLRQLKLVPFDSVPSTKPAPDNFVKTRTDAVTMGISVRIGAMAITIPALLFCLSVSETTKVNNGPGEIPAANPKTAPDRRNSNGSIIMVLFAGFFHNLLKIHYNMLYIVMRIALPIDTSRKNGRIGLSLAVSKKIT